MLFNKNTETIDGPCIKISKSIFFLLGKPWGWGGKLKIKIYEIVYKEINFQQLKILGPLFNAILGNYIQLSGYTHFTFISFTGFFRDISYLQDFLSLLVISSLMRGILSYLSLYPQHLLFNFGSCLLNEKGSSGVSTCQSLWMMSAMDPRYFKFHSIAIDVVAHHITSTVAHEKNLNPSFSKPQHSF